jgi:hypothetical protein
MSRAAVTFAVLQTEERTHTLGEDEDGVDENATRAAPFTMASQWQGISALNSSGADDDSVNEDLDDKVWGVLMLRRRMMMMMIIIIIIIIIIDD